MFRRLRGNSSAAASATLARRSDGIAVEGPASGQDRAFDDSDVSFTELSHVRLLAGFGSGRLRGRYQAVDDDGSGLRAAVEADAASGAVVAGVSRRMHTVRTQFRRQFQTFGRTRLHTKPASFAFFEIDRDITACWPCHVLSSPLPLLRSVADLEPALVFSQYSYSSLRKLGMRNLDQRLGALANRFAVQDRRHRIR